LISAYGFTAFAAQMALPSAVLGPVDFSHGFQRLIASACFFLLSSVQRGMFYILSA
jgi:hypothetical protein